MSMDYYINPNCKTECKNAFPEKLSNFFDEIGGCQEYSRVSQVEKILGIDLSLFQKFDCWIKLSEIKLLLENFILLITNTPQYYKKIIFLVRQNDGLILNPAFPEDHGYLSSGEILNELNILKSTITCYENHGATKVKLQYG